MKLAKKDIGLSEVQEVFSGSEGSLWELLMGRQIHVGGMESSMELANQAGIHGKGLGIDFCCCNGASMRFLTRFCGVKQMIGIDATETVIEKGRKYCDEEHLSDKITFIKADACKTGYCSNSADFIWGEDGWCYVVDKPRLIAEAVRLVKPGGIIAFTDWIEDSVEMTDNEAQRFLEFMKFPNIQNIQGYCDLLRTNGCEVLLATNTQRFKKSIDLYLAMLSEQFTYDALRIIDFNTQLAEHLVQEMMFIRNLAYDGKIIQGMFVARKTL